MRGGVCLEYTLARNSRPLPGVIDLFRKLEHVLLIYVQIPLYNVLNPEGDKEEREEKEAESTMWSRRRERRDRRRRMGRRLHWRASANVVSNNYDAYKVTELHIKSIISSRGIHSSSFNIVKRCVSCTAP